MAQLLYEDNVNIMEYIIPMGMTPAWLIPSY